MRAVGTLTTVLCCLAFSAPAHAIGQSEFIGMVSDETYEAAGQNRPSSMAFLKKAGVGLMRQTFNWEFLQHGQPPGELNWVWLDRFMSEASRHGISVLPILFNPPPEITTRPPGGGERGAYPPRDPGAIGDFGARIAARYGTSGAFWNEHPELPRLPIRAYQIWNEPPLPVYWRPAPDPAAYVRMLRAAHDRIKAVDPAAEIVTAGLPDSRIKGAVPIERFIRGMYAAGANGAFDTLALNAYASTGKGVVGKVRRFRRLMNRLGDADAAIRVTEFGWADRGPERKRGRYTAGRRGQARHVYESIRRLWAARRRLRLKGLVYYAWRDQRVYAGGKDFWGLHTGLNRIDGRPKLALRYFRRAVRGLR
jgi:polysaccharide biosynthesis protein PslG